MANTFLSLLDITALTSGRDAVGVVEEVVTYAPELEKVYGTPIDDTFDEVSVRTSYTDKAIFRSANEGVEIGASNFVPKRFDCAFIDAQLRIDEAVARKSTKPGATIAKLQANEAVGAMRAKAIAIGQQFYAGKKFDAKGFDGLVDFLTDHAAAIGAANVKNYQIIDAGGTSSTACEMVWYVWMHEQGVHLLFGKNQGVDIKPWREQTVTDSAGKSYNAWVSNLSGYLGLECAHNRAVGVIKNVDPTITNNAAVKPWTDQMDLDLYARFPVGLKPNLCFASRAAVASLQRSRTVTILANSGSKTAATAGVTANIAPRPTETASGVPIVETDSIIAGAQLTTI